MNSKYFLSLIIVATSINLYCSKIHSTKFKRLIISSDPHLQLATQKDIACLKIRDTDRTLEEKLSAALCRYENEYSFCRSQECLSNFNTRTLVLSSCVSVYLGWTNNKPLTGITLASTMIPLAYKTQTIAQDHKYDQELLIRMCTHAFELSDLELLQPYYQKRKDRNLQEFLKKIIERKQWIISNNLSNEK